MDEHGKASVVSKVICGGQAGLGPAWTRGEIEKPAGEKDMGTWKAGVYTEVMLLRCKPLLKYIVFIYF